MHYEHYIRLDLTIFHKPFAQNHTHPHMSMRLTTYYLVSDQLKVWARGCIEVHTLRIRSYYYNVHTLDIRGYVLGIGQKDDHKHISDMRTSCGVTNLQYTKVQKYTYTFQATVHIMHTTVHAILHRQWYRWLLLHIMICGM